LSYFNGYFIPVKNRAFRIVIAVCNVLFGLKKSFLIIFKGKIAGIDKATNVY